MKRLLLAISFGLLFSLPAASQQALVVKPLAEKKASILPTGPLFWRIETFPTIVQAQKAAGLYGLAAEAGGKAWLFTLGHAGETSSSEGTKIVEIGPIPEFQASEYLLRINDASGPPGSVTPVHTHPGSETFFVLTGETSQKSPHGVSRVAEGDSLVGNGADMPMQVSSSGSTDLHSLVMFVVDASKPFSSSAELR
jgi:hypothetical protein